METRKKMEQKNRLKGMTTYLCGSIDRAPDSGMTWRDNITPFLQEMGVVVFNPLKKPIDLGQEDLASRQERKQHKREGNFKRVAEMVKPIRTADLRMVDLSHFIIVHLNLNESPTGTYEELFWANRMKRPIILHCEQGKNNVPDWLFGCFPHEMMFSTWDEVRDYITKVDSGEDDRTFDRWMFFDMEKVSCLQQY